MDVADGLLPKVLPEKEAADEEREAYEEERRLFYVGMTRAKDELEIVTFRKAGLSSSFSQEVFPPKRKPGHYSSPACARGKKAGQRQAAALSGACLPGVPAGT